MPPVLALDNLRDCCDFEDEDTSRYRNACLVCMDSSGHSPGVSLELHGNASQPEYSLLWTNHVDTPMRRAHGDRVRAAEEGAIALAWLVIKAECGYIAVEESRRGGGFDYHLSDQSERANDFDLSGPRLEVSGIYKENGSNTIRTRLRDKRKRLKPGAPPTYVFVAEFFSPRCALELVS